MTALSYVTKKEMEDQTGFKTALGYSFPKEDKILIRKGLSKAKKKEVLAHEEEHMLKGEEGPFWQWAIPAAIGLFGAIKGSKDAKKATAAQTAAGEREIEFARESRDIAREDLAPWREAGSTALDALMSMTGLGGGGGGAAAPQPQGPRGPRRGRPQEPAIGSPYRGSGYNYSATDGGQRFVEDGYLGVPGSNPFQGRNYGGAIGYHEGGTLFNVNELGPENIYENGSYTRSTMPKTVPPSATGYVGRDHGGALGVADPGGFVNTPGQHIPGGTLAPPKSGGDYINPNIPPKGSTIDNDTGAVDGGYTRPQENPGGVEGGYNFMTDPGYEFRFQEGMRGLERGAAARGNLLSGGFARKAIRYGQDFASNEYSNVYNRIAAIAGTGQVSNQAAGGYAMQAGQQMGAGAAGIGNARASGYTNQRDIWGNYGADLAGSVPWGDIFNKGGGGGNYPPPRN